MPLLPAIPLSGTHTDWSPVRLSSRDGDGSDAINHGTIGIIIGILIVTSIFCVILLKIVERRRLNRGEALFRSSVSPLPGAQNEASRYGSRPLERERGRRDDRNDDVMSVVDALPLYEPRKSEQGEEITVPPPAYTRD